MRVYTHLDSYAYALKFIRACMFIRRNVDSVRAFVCAWVCTHIQIVALYHRCICISMYRDAYALCYQPQTRTYTCTHTHAHTHPHTHTCTHKNSEKSCGKQENIHVGNLKRVLSRKNQYLTPKFSKKVVHKNSEKSY